MISEFANFLLLRDVKTESESEDIRNFLPLLFDMMLRARSMAQISAVKMELSIGRAFLWIISFRTAAHTVRLWSFEPSMKTCKWLG